jgi:hypothetical protein
VGSFIRIGLGIEEGESSLCGGAPRAVIPDGILKCPDPACTHPKTYHTKRLLKGFKMPDRTSVIPTYEFFDKGMGV